jgi:diguanylate cyclase (GGDEF)-like protein/PAS domain S-box-containing protein
MLPALAEMTCHAISPQRCGQTFRRSGLRLLAAWLLIVLALDAFAATPLEVTIGVLTIRSPQKTLSAWQATADYLTHMVPGHRFQIVPIELPDLNEAAAQGRCEFILTNPSHYVFLEEKYRVNRIATLVNAWDQQPLKEFGGVVIVRDERQDLRELADLKGKRIAAVGEQWLGAYQAQAGELLARGIDPVADLQIYFTGEPQDRAVRDVMERRADAGFVRSGLIENMHKEGRIDRHALRVLGLRQENEYPHSLSTPLYPEWPFAMARRTSTRLARQVAIALLAMPADDAAARQGSYNGWTIPADYHAVRELMRVLHQPPYDTPPEFSWRDIVRRHEVSIFAGLFAALGLALLLVARFRLLNRTIVRQMVAAHRQADALAAENSARRQAETRLQLAASVFEHSHDGIAITDPDNVILEVNDAFCTITGYGRAEVVGKNPNILKSGRQSEAFYRDLWQSLAETGHWRGEIWNRRKNGEFYVEMLEIAAVRDAAGVLTHHVAVFNDITCLRHSQERLEHMAHYDPLTQLPNRALLSDRLSQSVALAQRNGSLLGVCFLDLDGFKPVNDEYGHEIGDLLLIGVARRLEVALREVDTVARLGGDEFVLLITGLTDLDELETILERIMEVLEQPFDIEGCQLQISASLGITIYPLDDADPESLLRHADQAMYQAKRSGRSRFSLFDAGQDKEAQSRQNDLDRLHQALHDGEFVLHYQPKVDMRQGKVVGCEALIRWQHPLRGLVLPGEFLPLVEQTDFMAEIDTWVIRAALRQIAHWQDDGLEMSVSVNVSARKLQSFNFIAAIEQLLGRHPAVPPARLEFEILESAALSNIDGVRETIRKCQELGIGFALDDFGTGYSSLSYLKRLPVDTIKIDQSFVRDLLDNPEDLAIVEGIVGLSHVFRRGLVGEGVESAEHGMMLMRLGCDVAQGYGIVRPMPAADVVHWVRQFRPDPQWTAWAGKAWDIADFPLLIAQSDHLKWVKQVARIVAGGVRPGSADQIIDHRQCRFGQWYCHSGRERYGDMAEFVSIAPIHEEIHRVGSEILRLMESGETGLAQQRLQRLFELRDRILVLLAALQGVVVSDTATAN